VLLQTSALYPGSSIGYQRSSLATEHDLVCSHAFFRVRQGGGAGARGGGAGRAPHLYAAIDGCKNPVQTEGVNKKLGGPCHQFQNCLFYTRPYGDKKSVTTVTSRTNRGTFDFSRSQGLVRASLTSREDPWSLAAPPHILREHRT
jgi:hypothetical protein